MHKALRLLDDFMQQVFVEIPYTVNCWLHGGCDANDGYPCTRCGR